MNPEPDREAALFQAALQLKGIARGAFLTQACHGDVTLRARLDSLLATWADSVRPSRPLRFSDPEPVISRPAVFGIPETGPGQP